MLEGHKNATEDAADASAQQLIDRCDKCLLSGIKCTATMSRQDGTAPIVNLVALILHTKNFRGNLQHPQHLMFEVGDEHMRHERHSCRQTIDKQEVNLAAPLHILVLWYFTT
jgi:hypothetical protein